MIFSGRTLENDRSIDSYNIQKDSTVHLVIKLNSSNESASSARPPSHTTQFPPPARSESSSSHQNWSSEVPRSSSSWLTVITPSGREVRLDSIDFEKMSVFELKRSVSVKERVPPNHQVLVYNKTQLQNSDPLSYYRLVPGSDIYLSYANSSKMNLYVKTLSGDTFMLSPSIYQSVNDIKEELRIKHKLNVNNQRLVFHGVLLDESSMLYECNLPNQCTMHIIKDPNARDTSPPPPPVSRQYQQQAPPIPILFRTLRGDIVTLLTYPNERVRDLKRRLQEREGFPRGPMNLVLGGTELRDEAFIEEYKLQQDSTLLVTFKVPSGLELSAIDMSNDELIPIDRIKVADRVEHLESEIRRLFKIDDGTALSLILNSDILAPQSTLSQYVIPKNPVIQVYKHSKREEKKRSLTVCTVTGIKSCCDLYLSQSKVIDLKAIIQDRLLVPTNEQVLVKRGVILEDYLYLNEALASKEGEDEEEDKYKIMLFTRVQATRTVTVILPNGSPVNLRVQSHQTILDLKALLNDRTVQPGQQVIRHGGRILEDHYCIGDYLLPEGARLTCSSLTSQHIHVFNVHASGRRVKKFCIESQSSLRVLKLLVSAEFSIPLDRLRLFFCGDLLYNEKPVDQYGFPTPCTLWADWSNKN